MILQLYTQPNKAGTKYTIALSTVQHPASGSNTDQPTTQYYQGQAECTTSFGTNIVAFLRNIFNHTDGNITLYTKTNDSIYFEYYAWGTEYINVRFNRVNTSFGCYNDQNYGVYFANVARSPVLQAYNFVVVKNGYYGGHYEKSFNNGSKELVAIADVVESPITITESIGDNGDYEFTGDSIDLPSAPDETISGVLASGFLNIYSPTASQLQNFGGALWTNAFNVKWYDLDSVSNLIYNTISDPINFIIGLFILPVSPSVGNPAGIYLGGINVNTVSANRVTKQYKVIDFGTLNINEVYGSYLDYSYSRLSIYLPYIGMADIDVQEVTGGTVTLQYIIDCFTGACIANVKCEKVTPTAWGETYTNSSIHSYSGNVSIQLPISAGSFDTMTQGLINVGLGLVSGQPQTVAKSAGDVIQSVGGDATTRGSLSSNTGRLCYQTPYLMFTRPIETRPANMGNLHGYGAGFGGKLSQLSGYVECSDVKLDDVTATDTELSMIESLLKSGVYV